ncbi:MAG: hypothetical protein HZB16_03915 [Armatimonadetes bacterium]|nr:hypothetical protein [Armatimonadota bacterium]
MAQSRRVRTGWLGLLAVVVVVAVWAAWSPLGLRRGLARAARGHSAEWAPTALVLGPPAPSPPNPSPDDQGWQGAAPLDQFWLRAGRGAPSIRTRARVTWDDEALYVGAECFEPDAAYHPQRTTITADPLVPVADRLDIQFCSDWQGAAWWFTLGADGTSRLRWRPAGWWYVTNHERLTTGVRARTEAVTGGWRAVVTIPWQLLGGRPHDTFGLNVIRCHDRAGEQSSPMALDWPEWPTGSGLLETSFGPRAKVVTARGMLARLPSGRAVWQRPTQLTRATPAERTRLLALRRELRGRTTAATLAERVHWAQRWYEQLVLDGYSFFGVDVQWNPGKNEWHPHEARAHVTRALRRGEVARACAVVDTFLGQLDRASRQWYADGTVLDGDSDAWTAVNRVSHPRLEGDVAHFPTAAGAGSLDLQAALIEVDGVAGWRLWASPAGRVDGGQHLPLRLRTDGTGVTLSADADRHTPRLRYRPSPWRIEVLADDGEVRWALDGETLALRFDSRGQVKAVDLRGPLWQNEAVVGGGERFDALDQRGRSYSLWGEDAWDGTMRGVGNHSYKPIAFWQSSRGWSMYWNTTYRVRCDLGASVSDRYRFTAHGPVLDWWVWTAPPTASVKAFTALTGRATVPPRWAFTPWMGGNAHRWQNDPRPDASAVVEDARRYRELDIPLGAAYLEAELSAKKSAYDGLRALGVRPIAWSDCNVMRVAMFGGIATQVREDGLPWVKLDAGRRTDWIDFTSGLALPFVRQAWRERLGWGLSGCMVDYGDVLPEEARLADGRGGAEAHNTYGVDFAKTYHRVFREARGDDFVLIGRPMGPGAQRYAVPFAGDQPASFRGLRQMVTAAITDSASGLGLFTGDIGLFAGLPDKEVYLRSLQFGALGTLMRNHGWAPREPWRYGDDVTVIYRRWSWLRMSLLDYLVGNAQEAAASGLPALRAMIYDWPQLPDAWQAGDQLMCGPDLLIAPVLEAARSRSVWLPPGDWVDLWTGRRTSGPCRVTAPAPLDTMPIFLRAGALLPLQLSPSLTLGDSLSSGSRRVLLLTPPDRDRTLALPRDGAHTSEARLERAEDGFVLRLPSEEPASLLVVMGGRLRSARLGGAELPRTEEPTRTLLAIPAGGARAVTCRLLAGTAGIASARPNEGQRGAR